MSEKYDGHIHSPFCPHGTTDPLESYVEEAIKLGFSGLTFTEHAPLPSSFLDPVPLKDSGMSHKRLEAYFDAVEKIKESYRNQIEIKCGLEVDYIEGFEEETKAFLDKVGSKLDDAILSVHFIHHNYQYTCLDYSPGSFEELVTSLGSVDHVHKKYYETVLKSLTADLGVYKPKRLGHISLVNKFQEKFPYDNLSANLVTAILDEVKKQELSLDYNGAGTVKPLCKEPYPPSWVIEEAISRKIPLIYGSDAHSYKGIGQGFDQLVTSQLSSPLPLSRS
ncbi:histidinol-phosphatase HisJ [Guptibacillus algicola]|uniref:histidinol-phosphatase HisJ n=1 Tax=Guptibacillus algicola TaxID=225844 RepID=UPI001CD3A170|nr:histidinol-phosphatase HisJ [Alkalihalobacillus algicola]MCA0986373.1 histidinol-phosphatase HisJ [Alkalihalobacillus algicola]